MKRLLLEKIISTARNTHAAERNEALEAAAGHGCWKPKGTSDDGIGSYHLVNRWSSSYPETTGYIIPTLLSYDRKFDQERMVIGSNQGGGFPPEHPERKRGLAGWEDRRKQARDRFQYRPGDPRDDCSLSAGRGAKIP